MTVSELRAKLAEFEDDSPIAVAIGSGHPGYPPPGITEVREDAIYDTWYVFLEVDL